MARNSRSSAGAPQIFAPKERSAIKSLGMRTFPGAGSAILASFWRPTFFCRTGTMPTRAARPCKREASGLAATGSHHSRTVV